MKRRLNERYIVVEREAGGFDRVIDRGSPTRGPHPWFGVWEMFGRDLDDYGGRVALVAAGFVQVDAHTRVDSLVDEQWALHTPILPFLALYLLGERFVEWANLRLMRLAWNLGLFEVKHEAMIATWRWFSPYPWRGRRRVLR